MERYARAHAVARCVYRLPGTRTAARLLVRGANHHLNLSRTNRQRLYNFFAPDVVPEHRILCDIPIDARRSVTLDLDLADSLSSQWYYFGYRNYELGVTRLLFSLLPHKQCMIDVGANVGFYSVLASVLCGERAQVHAFEPAPQVFSQLERNRALNQLGHLETNDIALSEVDGTASLFLPSNQAWSNASLLDSFGDTTETVTVRTMRLDTYCALRGIDRVDLIKIDAEGAELPILRGFGQRLHDWGPDLIVEVLADYADGLDNFFRSTRYRAFLITDDGLVETDRVQADPRFRDYYLTLDGAHLGAQGRL